MKQQISSRIIYPGVFQPSGIEFELAEEALVTVTITNAADEILAIPVNGQKYLPGTHEVMFTVPRNVTENLYYTISVKTSEGIQTERKRFL